MVYIYVHSFAPVRRNMAKTITFTGCFVATKLRRRQGLDWALNSSRFKEICALGSHWDFIGKP